MSRGCGRQVGAMPGIHINDYSDFYTQLAIQGPKAEATLQKLTDADLSAIKNYWFTWGKVCGLVQRDDRAHRLHRRGRVRDLHPVG